VIALKDFLKRHIGKAKGKQFVAQPKSIKQKVKPFRKI
jgi:hypothetical protein